jgi:hypothetical protein
MKVMKRVKKYLNWLFIVLALSGCKKSYFETSPSTQVSDANVFNTTSSTYDVLKGVYRQWRSWATTAPAPNRMDCSGLQSLALVRETMGPDVLITKSWYSAEVAYSVYTQDTYRALYSWWLFYNSINNINNVLAHIDQADGDQADKDHIRGEAMAMRAFCYFELVNTYAPTYAIGKSMPGVPIYTDPTNAQTAGNPRSTVEEVYNLIVSDLTTAAGLMTTQRTSKEYMNIDVVNALLARVYLTMGQYDLAAGAAGNARQSYPLMSASDWTDGFGSNANAEWIWAQVNTSLENPDWGSAVGLLDTEHGGGEADFKVSDALYSLYSATDIRKSVIYLDANGKWGSRKFRVGNPIYVVDYPYIRSAEMYLIEAEADARMSHYTDAQTLLFDVQQARDPNAVASGNTGQALIDEIITEKRKEFWGEGIYFRDMLRTSMPLTRDPLHTTPLNIPANHWEFIFQIPTQEITINKSLSPTDQNPASGPIN